MAPTFDVRQHYESSGNGHWLGSPCPLAPDSSCPTTARARARPRGPALQRSLSILCNDEGGGRGGGGREGEKRSLCVGLETGEACGDGARFSCTARLSGGTGCGYSLGVVSLQKRVSLVCAGSTGSGL